MDLAEFIAREIALAHSDKLPDPLALRFSQLHETPERCPDDEQAYRRLLAIMTSRWRWYRAGNEARRISGARTISTAPVPD